MLEDTLQRSLRKRNGQQDFEVSEIQTNHFEVDENFWENFDSNR